MSDNVAISGIELINSRKKYHFLGEMEKCNSITAAQCVELSVSNVSNWMGDHQRKHCAQLPGEARKLEEY